MNQNIDQAPKVRIANFSTIDLPADHRLDVDCEAIETTVAKMRHHADLPYVFVVAKEKAAQLPELLKALRAIRSPCYPYALFAVGGAEVAVGDTDLDVVHLSETNPQTIRHRIDEYVRSRFNFDENQLRMANANPIPASVDVVVVGAGVTGLYAANRLMDAGISFCLVDKSDRIGGIWAAYANRTSRVNSSEGAYRLFEKKSRSNSDHSTTREILEDVTLLAQTVSDRLFLSTAVERIEANGGRYRIRLNRGGAALAIEAKGIILAINDRVGTPRTATWENQAAFKGKIVAGLSNDTEGLDWRNRDVVIVGMGAFAVENARTALEGGARHVTLVCRRHGTVCPKIIDYLNFATPYDNDFKHDKKSNLMNMMYWKKLYDLSGAKQPECWMGKIKHDGHTISVSDIWFVGHHLKKIETVTGEISALTPNGVVVDGQRQIQADIIVNCIGFERNTPAAEALSGYRDMTNINYIAKDFLYLADAYIDGEAFNSLFGSSVLEMVKFYVEVFILFFDNPAYDDMMATDGIEKIPIADRKWSHYIDGAMALIRRYPDIEAIARRQVARRTSNFLQTHDLETYIAQNKREWIDTHSMLAGRPLKEEECLPYVFERLLKAVPPSVR